MRNIVTVISAISLLVLCTACAPLQKPGQQLVEPVKPVTRADNVSQQRIFGMKGVAVDLPQQDFNDMRDAGIGILATEWGMEESVEHARLFLDKAEAAGLKVVMDGGFSARAWGFSDDDWDNLPDGKRPAWQKKKVQAWINALKDHPAIYAWDICNEFGENLPSGVEARNSEWPKSMITPAQIKQSSADVLEADSSRPIHVRMYEWDSGQMPSHVSSLLDSGVTDIISLNLYSNYLYKGQLQWPGIVADAGQYCVDEIMKRDPGIRVWVSLGAFEYMRLFQRPTVAGLTRDIRDAAAIKGIEGITFFCWGPVSQWDDKCRWYLPTSGPDLWQVIKQEISILSRP